MRISWSLVATVVVVVTSSCGSPRGRPDPGGPANTGETASNPAACAATFAETPVGESCSDTTAACAYAEGRCWCGPRAYCGGAAPPEELVAELAHPAWQCQPVRTDGCPEVQPTGACTDDGKACSYGDCCVLQTTCQGGTWVARAPACPP